MKSFIHFFLLLLLIIPGSAFAQTTGAFQTSIPFMGQPRQLALYVPTNYTAATKYRLMICLHGLGDNSVNYRDALVNSLDWDNHMPNTIFVCPEAAATNADYFEPAGGEAIIPQSIAWAMANYHIDTANVVLQGFSLGGRAALRYGLDHPTVFSGLLLNTPAVQGVKEALNGRSVYPFNYANASQVPIYITHGATDIAYSSPIDSAMEQLVLHDGAVRLSRIAGMGHTIPPFAQMANVLAYFSSPAHAGADLDVFRARVPQRSCNASVPATLLIRNTGAVTLTSAAFQYSVNGNNLVYNWSGSLPPFKHAFVTLPALTATAASNTLSVQVTTLNGSITDTVVANNGQTASFRYAATGTPLPLAEGFEGASFPPAGWELEESGDFYSYWDADNTVAKTGNNSVSAFNTIWIFDNAGRKESLLSPVLNFGGAAHPWLTFDLSFNYHHFAPPQALIDTVFADTLEVSVSTDCGSSYTRVFKKGGAELATFAQPILNPLSIPASFIDPADSNWRSVGIDLSAYSGNSGAVVKFTYTSALGGSINLDNVRFTDGPAGIRSTEAAGYRVYPNPATDRLTIDAGDEAVTGVRLTDISGKEVMTAPGGTVVLDTRSLSNGVYFLQVFSKKGSAVKQVVIRH